jgi:hypothetical protein
MKFVQKMLTMKKFSKWRKNNIKIIFNEKLFNLQKTYLYQKLPRFLSAARSIFEKVSKSQQESQQKSARS